MKNRSDSAVSTQSPGFSWSSFPATILQIGIEHEAGADSDGDVEGERHQRPQPQMPEQIPCSPPKSTCLIGASMNRPTMISAGPNACAGMAATNGEKISVSRKHVPVTRTVKPVRPPASIPGGRLDVSAGSGRP